MALSEALLVRGYRLVTGGTDTHLLLVDLTDRKITGKDAQEALDRAWITANKNTIPFDTRSPMVTSGIRLGTPAVTTRGMREPEMVRDRRAHRPGAGKPGGHGGGGPRARARFRS